jgi:hypothetical protein
LTALATPQLGLPNQVVSVQASAHGGLNRLTVSITREEMAQILEEKPHVKRAYLAQVHEGWAGGPSRPFCVNLSRPYTRKRDTPPHPTPPHPTPPHPTPPHPTPPRSAQT